MPNIELLEKSTPVAPILKPAQPGSQQQAKYEDTKQQKKLK